MTGAAPRPSTRLSTREPAPKRRRAPPPLSVTNVFSDARLPDTAAALWRWPVASWYFGDLASPDLQLAADRPFVRSGGNLPPPGKHYRLRWLEEDAHKFVSGEDPPLPEPLPPLPYARQKDSTACARPSKALGAGAEKNPPGRPRKRQCLPKDPTLVEPATIGFGDKGADFVKSEIAFATKKRAPSPESARVGAQLAAFTPMKVEPNVNPKIEKKVEPKVEPKIDKTIEATTKTATFAGLPANSAGVEALEGQRKVASALNFCTSPLSTPSPSAPNFTAPGARVELPANASPSSPVSPAPQSLPLKPKETEVSTSPKSNSGGGDDDSDEDAREDMLLQFVSPNEPRLMGTLMYSMPINRKPEKEAKDAPVDEPPPEVKPNNFAEEDIRVEGLDLEFRKSTRSFEDAFDDLDTKDDLRPEILRLNNVLDGLVPKTKPLRNAAFITVQAEIQRQKRFVDMVEEEKRIMARLREIEKDKAAAKAAKKAAEKAAEKAAAARARAESRRLSDLGGAGGAQGRPRRPSRKIEPESDDENVTADHDDVKIVPGSVVVVAKPVPSTVKDEHLDKPKPHISTGLVEQASPVLIGPQSAPAVAEGPKHEVTADRTVEDAAASKTVERGNREDTEGSAEVKRAPGQPIIIDTMPRLKIHVGGDIPKVAAAGPPERKRRKSVEFADIAPAASIFVPTSALQLERNQTGSGSLSPADCGLMLDESAGRVNSREVGQKVRNALIELTALPAERLFEKSLTPESNCRVGAERPEPFSLKTEHGVNVAHQPEEQLTPDEREEEVTTTPFTEIDMDVLPDSDDESRPKERPDGIERKEEMASETKTESEQAEFASDSSPVANSNAERSSCAIFPEDRKEGEQLVRMPSPVSPLQAAAPTCGFVVVPATGPMRQVLTSGTALVQHMEAMRARSNDDSSPNCS